MDQVFNHNPEIIPNIVNVMATGEIGPRMSGKIGSFLDLGKRFFTFPTQIPPCGL